MFAIIVKGNDSGVASEKTISLSIEMKAVLASY